MPAYTYRCSACQTTSEVAHSIHENGPQQCSCGGPLRRVINKVAVTFRGSGFYRTDSRSNA